MSAFFLGCAVWAYQGWIGDLFPEGSRSSDFLRLYSRRLTTVEGNTTFYATPREEVVLRWADETPATFRFCFKLPREVSHSGALTRQIGATQAFLTRMAPLGERLGPFFLQLPPGYSPAQLGDLGRWLAAWPTDQRIAVEVRHPDWYAPAGEAALMELLERYAAGRVVMDVRPIRQPGEPDVEELVGARNRKPDVPLHPLHSSGIALVRYIGHPDLEQNEPWLDEWAARLSAWLAAGLTVYCFMHCPDESRSPSLCRAIQRRLEARGVVPPLPWDAASPPAQLGLLF